MWRFWIWLFPTLLLPTAIAQSSTWPEEAAYHREMAEHIASQSADIARIWPDFWAEDQAFSVYDKSGATLLVTDKEALPNYTVHSGNFYFYPERLPNTPDFAYYIDYELPSGQLVTGVRLTENRHHVVASLAHEAFHGFQRRTFTNLSNNLFLPVDYFESQAVQGLLNFQFDLARQAQRSNDPALLRDYIKFRLAFAHSLAPEIAQLLADFEHVEGTAQYVGLRAVSSGHAHSELGDFFSNFKSGFNHANGLRTSSYATGAFLIQALIYHVDSPKPYLADIAAGQTPLNAVAEALDITEESALTELESILDRHNAADFIHTASQTPSASTSLYANIDETHPFSLTFSIRLPRVEGRTEMPLRFGAGPEGFQNLTETKLFIPNPKTFQFEMPAVEVNIVGVPVLVDMSEISNQLLRFTLWTTEPIAQLSDVEALAGTQPEAWAINFGESSITILKPELASHAFTTQRSTIHIQLH